ncbi:MAG: PocR ligand-binding domain-containing protein, partial [Spirochaetales bacterium]|nr:PocR ligand-binding domain-containing protein [Spirochaetales bacterium]
ESIFQATESIFQATESIFQATESIFQATAAAMTDTSLYIELNMEENRIISLQRVLNISILQQFLDEFELLTGLSSTLVDERGKMITAPRGSREFCLILGKSSMRRCCRESDREGCAKAAALKRPYIYQCHAGLIDIVIPIIIRDRYVGAILTGQTRVGEMNMDRFDRFIGLPEVNDKKDILLDAFHRLPVKDMKTIEAGSEMLFNIVNYIVDIEMENVELKRKSKGGGRSRQEIVEEAKEYIHSHFDQEIKLADIARTACVSDYYMSHMFKDETGISFIDYVTSVRIEKAKNLLRNTSLDIIDIAFRVGYNDSNYFSHVFRKKEGLSPTGYRRKKTHITPYFDSDVRE